MRVRGGVTEPDALRSSPRTCGGWRLYGVRETRKMAMGAGAQPSKPQQLNKHMKTYEITPHMTSLEKQRLMQDLVSAAMRALAAKAAPRAN
jgi:hypothetical protein